MTLRNGPTSFGTVTKVFHWLMAVSVLTQYVSIALRENVFEKGSSWHSALMLSLHKPLGTLMLALGCLAFAWRLSHTGPHIDWTGAVWEKRLASTVHWSLYVFLIAMSLSGFLMSGFAARPISMFGLFQIPPVVSEKITPVANFFYESHETLAVVGYVLIGLHLAGLAKQTLIRREWVIGRML